MKKIKGFTLIELIVVISIIGVLMAFVLPSISGVIERSHKTNAMNCLKQIANAYISYREDKGDITFSDAPNLKAFALLLAQEGLLNDPKCYVFSFDSLANSVNKITRDSIVFSDGKSYANCWSSSANLNGFSVHIIVGLSDACQSSSTPIAYTRGLQSNGIWGESTGVFGKKGGYIAFLDGRVKWFDKLTDQLSKADMTGPTCDIRLAIPSDATIITGL